jgi:hypothetical protein
MQALIALADPRVQHGPRWTCAATRSSRSRLRAAATKQANPVRPSKKRGPSPVAAVSASGLGSVGSALVQDLAAASHGVARQAADALWTEPLGQGAAVLHRAFGRTCRTLRPAVPERAARDRRELGGCARLRATGGTSLWTQRVRQLGGGRGAQRCPVLFEPEPGRTGRRVFSRDCLTTSAHVRRRADHPPPDRH